MSSTTAGQRVGHERLEHLGFTRWVVPEVMNRPARRDVLGQGWTVRGMPPRAEWS